MEYKTVNDLPTIVVMMGRPVHGMASIVSSHLRYKIINVLITPETVKQSLLHASRPAQQQAACFFYLGARSSLVIG